MELEEQFTALRKSLEPVVKEWTPILSVLKKKVCAIKNEDERLAFTMELNKLCNAYDSMKNTSLDSDDMTKLEIQTNMRDLHQIRMELNTKEQLDRIGDEIITKLIAPVEEVLTSSLKEQLLQRIRCVIKLKKAIKLLKQCRNLIPYDTRFEIQQQINTCIVTLNRYFLGSFGLGILLRFGKEPENIGDGMVFQYDVGVKHSVMCQQCSHVKDVYSGLYNDVYAHVHCPNCGSHQLSLTPSRRLG